MNIGVISPQDWGLPVAMATSKDVIPELGVSPAEIEYRIRANVYEWLPRQFDEEEGAFHGFYRAPDRHLDFPQTVNLIAPWELLAAYDRYGDEELLTMARRAADWFYGHFVISHPMSVVAGGVRDGLATHEVWTKFASEFVILSLGLHRRTDDDTWLERAIQSGRYLIQAARHGHAPKYDLNTGRWVGQDFGWQSFGRAIEACLLLAQATDDDSWQERALDWGRFGLSIQADDGCFYLIDKEYYNTDLAADELRGLTFLYELSAENAFLRSAQAFADWHLRCQQENGAWPLTIDRDGNVVMPVVGPGDIPNIGIALLRLAHVTGEKRYREAACRCFRYTLSVQAIPGSDHPYLDDPHVRWGFWSWDPYYDYTMSGDQSTHHVRGLMFFLDEMAAPQNLNE